MMNVIKEEWIVPLKGLNFSGTYNLNFIWKNGSFYIMDNHRAALWCWFQHINLSDKYNLFHIDRHTDTLYSNIENWKKHMPDMTRISIEEYLELYYINGETDRKLFRWDNYLSLFMECYPHVLDECLFATHGEGDIPRFGNLHQIYNFWDVPLNMDYWINSSKHNWVFNIDIDYFTAINEKYYIKIFSDDFIRRMFEPVAEAYNHGKISVITISLSPECSGGWAKSLNMCSEICSIFDIKFNLPMEEFKQDT